MTLCSFVSAALMELPTSLFFFFFLNGLMSRCCSLFSFSSSFFLSCVAVSPPAFTRQHCLLAPLWIPPSRQPDSPQFSLRDFDKSLRTQAESLTYFLMSEYCKCTQRLCILYNPPPPPQPPPFLSLSPPPPSLSLSTIPTVFLLAHTHSHENTCR